MRDMSVDQDGAGFGKFLKLHGKKLAAGAVAAGAAAAGAYGANKMRGGGRSSSTPAAAPLGWLTDAPPIQMLPLDANGYEMSSLKPHLVHDIRTGAGFKSTLLKVSKGAAAAAAAMGAAYATHHIATRGGGGKASTMTRMTPAQRTDLLFKTTGGDGFGSFIRKHGKKIAGGVVAAGAVAAGAYGGRHAAGLAGVSGADPNGWYADRRSALFPGGGQVASVSSPSDWTTSRGDSYMTSM
jgi:hypothetical protein